ncbi:MAG: hypothetical protein ACYC5G_00680 [Candidatus Doudnabacteria bacterium]
MMTTRNRAAPRSMAVTIVFTAILAAAALIASTPSTAVAASISKFQQYNEAPAATITTIQTANDDNLGMALEVASPPTVAWTNLTNANAAIAYNLPATASTRAAPLTAAANNMVTYSTVNTENARAAPTNFNAANRANYSDNLLAATSTAAAKNYVDAGTANDFKMLSSGLTDNTATIDAKKTTAALARSSG